MSHSGVAKAVRSETEYHVVPLRRLTIDRDVRICWLAIRFFGTTREQLRLAIVRSVVTIDWGNSIISSATDWADVDHSAILMVCVPKIVPALRELR